MVALGAIAKGRNSYFKLNGVLRSMAGFLITLNLHLALVWIASGWNPADVPSRFKPIPPTKEAPSWLRAYFMKGSVPHVDNVKGVEIFSGTAVFTAVCRLVGIPMAHPFDILYGSHWDAFFPKMVYH